MSSHIEKCLSNYDKLIHTKYIFVIGRKNQVCELSICFDKYDFFHLAGLHYLSDIRQFHGSREKIYDKLQTGEISPSIIEKSVHYSKIEGRVDALSELAELLESDKLIFRFNSSSSIETTIDHDYLVELNKYDSPRFLFLKELSDNVFHGVSLFPMGYKDYTVGETRWTILKVSKLNLSAKDSEPVIVYQSPSYKEAEY